ncbi:hypothetical protein MMC21_004555 [Puttea exsequens]|nr:hypothetical protein [Puttea exsequens]
MASSQQLEVIGLISGGKDSFYSLLHCLASGHRIVALANLHPRNHEPELQDCNSYMYQTAGHGIIPLFSGITGLPLFRRVISGSAVNSAKDYQCGTDSEDTDETESLIPLLSEVVRHHPTANAICSGAILSTYQRTRIESIALRLGLTPLNYLWQFPLLPPAGPGTLLDDMAAAGFDVRIVKVASGGLDEDLLWGNLMDSKVRRKVERSVARFGGSVLGEGGEYETLVVDGPCELFKGRVEVHDHERWIGRAAAGESWVQFTRDPGRVIAKTDILPQYNQTTHRLQNNGIALDAKAMKSVVRPIPLWDTVFEALSYRLTRQDFTHKQVSTQSANPSGSWESSMVVRKCLAMITIQNATGSALGQTRHISITNQMMNMNTIVLNILKENNRTADDITMTTILLRNMSDFTTMNSIYKQLFKLPNPAVRVTIACGNTLPPTVDVMASFTVSLCPRSTRDGLHVQSRSYWAPANIGPYSQAIAVPLSHDQDASLVYIAGQIPLVPASMEVLQAGDDPISTFIQYSCLALQHLWRIGSAMNVRWWAGAVAFIAGGENIEVRARIAWEAWKTLHEPDLWGIEEAGEDTSDGLDEWDRRYGGQGSLVSEPARRQTLPDFEWVSKQRDTPCAPCFFAVQVDGLPRACGIEWQGLGLASEDLSFAPLCYREIPAGIELRPELLQAMERKPEAVITVYTPEMASISDLDVQIIPCRSVWGREGVRLKAGIAMISYSGG